MNVLMGTFVKLQSVRFFVLVLIYLDMFISCSVEVISKSHSTLVYILSDGST